jgi:hypothetical protein
MSTESFEGNVPVSTARQVFKGRELGRGDFVKQAVVDKGLPIQEAGFPVEDNSEILGWGFPEEAAVKGLVHDAAVELYSREPDFRSLGTDPSTQEIHGILEGAVDGSGRASPELRSRLNSLETGYDVAPGQVLDYEFDSGKMSGMTVSQVLKQVAEYREEKWRQDTEGYQHVLPEQSLFADGLSGRMDLMYSGAEENPDQIREIKMGEETSKYDEFQAAAYWLMHGDETAEAVVEYPLVDERLEFNPDEDTNDFDPREYAFDIYRSRDAAKKAIEELRSLQSEYFETHESREKATREALRNMEVR